MVADAPPAFSSNRASFAQRQVTQEQLRATQEELATKIRELQIYESNYIQLKKDLTRWKKKFEFIFKENELLSLETAKLDASHKQISFLKQEIKFKEEESEALRGLVSALEASNKKARVTRLESSARLAGRKDLPAAALAGAALLDESEARAGTSASAAVASAAGESELLEQERRERALEKERFLAEIQALKSENTILLKDLDRRDASLQLGEEKIAAHKERIASLEQSLQDEQDQHMRQLREKQDALSDLETQLQQLERRRRSSAVSRDEAEAFGLSHRLKKTHEDDEDGDPGDDEDEEPDTPPGTPPPISAGGLLPPTDPTVDHIIRDWEDDKKIRRAKSTQFDWDRIEAFIHKLPFEAKEGAERILRQALDPDQFPEVSESQLLVRGVPPECKKELHDFLVPLLKAHSHVRVTYATMQRRTLVTDVRLTLEPRESEFTGGLAFGEKRFGQGHAFFGPSHDDVAKLVLHTARTLTTEKKAIYVSKPQQEQATGQANGQTTESGVEPPTTPNEAGALNGEPAAAPATTLAGEGKAGSGKKWTVPIGLSDKTKKLMGNMAMAAKQRVTRLNQTKYVHEGSSCQFCKTTPIVGSRYSCSTCVGFELCEGCYSLGGHGLENSDELFYRVQELVLARCPRLVEELDLLELLRFEICRSNLRKFSFCLNWLADIVNGKSSQQLQARALEIPGIRRDIRKLFVPLLIRVCSDREDLEVKTEWELESDNAAEVRSVDDGSNASTAGSSAYSRGSIGGSGEGDGRFLETLRIWVADQYRTTSPFVERSLLKFREGMAVEGDSDKEDEEEQQDQYPDQEDRSSTRRRAMTAAARMTDTSSDGERVASSRKGFLERNRMISQEF